MKLLVIGVLITSMWVIKVKIFMVLVMYFDNLISTVAIRDKFEALSISNNFGWCLICTVEFLLIIFPLLLLLLLLE